MKLVILFSVLINGCARIELKNKSQTISQDNEGVILDLSKNLKKNNETIFVNKREETIRLGSNGGEVFSENGENKILQSDDKRVGKLKIGINFGPGLIRGTLYTTILKRLEKQGTPPEVLTGTEMGGVVAAMYACGITTELIDWTFFKYLKHNPQINLLVKSDLQIFDQNVLSILKNLRIETCAKKLFLTVYDHRDGKTYYFDHGNVRDLLYLGFKLRIDPVKYKTGVIYSTAAESEIYNGKLMANLGADFKIAVDAISLGFKESKNSDLLKNYWIKAKSLSRQKLQSFDHVINLPLGDLELDSSLNLPIYQQKVEHFLNGDLNTLRRKIEEKERS